jgi:4-amino-4-deoxy-L-arabinose transferase-like glycosyltransferase
MAPVSSPRFKLFLLLLITLLAAFFRLYKIDSLPPGDGHDPAYYGVDALAVLRGERPIFFPGLFGGREPLFSYLVAACYAVLGAVGPLGIHVASALVGILTVPAVYLVAEEMFASEEGLLRAWGGPLAALAVAVSYWHLNWCRYALRVILVPLFAALVFYFLWRGLRRGSRRAFAGCGFFLGLSMYTYQAARLLPVLVPLGFLLVLWRRRSVSKEDLVNFAIVVAVAAIVFAPLGDYFLQHPGRFTRRIEQTLMLEENQGLAGNGRLLLERLIEIARVFNVRGEAWQVVNLPGRPVLNPFLSVLFYLGLAISLLRFKKPTSLFLLGWLAVMLTPALLADEAAIAKRALGSLPAAMMLVASCALYPADLLRRWVGRPARFAGAARAAWLTAVAVGLIYSGVLTFHDYFHVWAQDPDLFIHFDVGIDAIGTYIGELPPDEDIYLSPVPPDHPSVILNSQGRSGVKGYNGRVCLVVPRASTGGTTYVVVPKDDPNSLNLLPDLFPSGGVTHEGPLYYGQPFFRAFRAPAGAEAQIAPLYHVEAEWEGKIRLLGYDLDKAEYRAGETIHLTLYYAALTKMTANYTVFTHLLGPFNPATNGPVWAQDDSEPCRRGYPTSVWAPGEVVIDAFALSVPAGAPAGEYTLAMGFYAWPSPDRLSAVGPSGAAADHVVLGAVRVAADQ